MEDSTMPGSLGESPSTALAPAGAGSPLAPRQGDGRPESVAVYLTGHPAMLSSLLACLRALGRPAGGVADVLAFPWDRMQVEHAVALRAALVGAYAPASARRAVAALRGVWLTAWRMGRLTGEERARLADLDKIKGDSAPAGRMMAPEEVARLLGDDHARDRALAALAVFSGLRREEISALDLADLEQATGRLVVRHGKGEKRREVFLAPDAVAALAGWLAVRGTGAGPLFWRAVKGGRAVAGARLSPTGVWRVLRRVAERCGVEHVTPHDFRRTFASTALASGTDLGTVQKLMGHESPRTTMRYDRRGDDAKRAAALALARAFKPKGGENDGKDDQGGEDPDPAPAG